MQARGYDRRQVPVVRPGVPEPAVAAEQPPRLAQGAGR
jgi:hypothetical protein